MELMHSPHMGSAHKSWWLVSLCHPESLKPSLSLTLAVLFIQLRMMQADGEPSEASEVQSLAWMCRSISNTTAALKGCLVLTMAETHCHQLICRIVRMIMHNRDN